MIVMIGNIPVGGIFLALCGILYLLWLGTLIAYYSNDINKRAGLSSIFVLIVVTLLFYFKFIIGGRKDGEKPRKDESGTR